MNIINLGILAHIDAGKTSVTENLLFASGATEKCGRVDNGDTITDSMDIEKRRGITVRASTTSIIWNGVKCNIIDTPGHMDFIAEVERTFKMLDGAVLILSAKEGIQAQTKLLFSTLQKLQIPTIIFINKIDRAGVNLERLYMDIKTNLSQDVLCMQTVVDGSVYPVCSQTYIKEEYKEFVCNHDDDILERYLADSEISPADYWNTIIALVAKAKVYPVLHGSAMFNIGINELLDAISSFILPPASVSNRLSAYLYKIEHDPFIIGDVFALRENEDTYNVGWHFNKRFEGKGFACEAAAGLLDYLFREAGARRIYGFVEDDNIRSERLCERLGMRREGCFKEFVTFVNNPDGSPKYEDTCVYAILEKEWNTIRQW